MVGVDLTFRSFNWTRNPAIYRVILTWVIVSFVGSLLICCEVLAATVPHVTAEHDSLIAAQISPQGSHGHATDNRHEISLSSLVDEKFCADKGTTKLATLDFLPSKLSDDLPLVMAARQVPDFSCSRGTDSGKRFREPKMGSPPLYILFRRLLIDYTLA